MSFGCLVSISAFLVDPSLGRNVKKDFFFFSSSIALCNISPFPKNLRLIKMEIFFLESITFSYHPPIGGLFPG